MAFFDNLVEQFKALGQLPAQLQKTQESANVATQVQNRVLDTTQLASSFRQLAKPPSFLDTLKQTASEVPQTIKQIVDYSVKTQEESYKKQSEAFNKAFGQNLLSPSDVSLAQNAVIGSLSAPEDVALLFGKIAKSKVSSQIAGWLKTLGVGEKEIPQLSEKLVSITNPEEVKMWVDRLRVKPSQSLSNPLAQEAQKYKSAEEFVKANLPKGFKQFSEAEKQATNLLNKYSDSKIDVYGSFSTGVRRGSGKTLPDLDVIIEDPKIAQDFLNHNKEIISNREAYAIKYNSISDTNRFKTPFEAVGRLDIPEKYQDLSNKFSDVKIKINDHWFSIHSDGTARALGDSLIKEQLINRKPLKQALEDFTNRSTKSQLTDIWEEGNKVTAPLAKNAVIDLSKERKFITSVREAVPEIKIAGQYIPRDTDTLAIKAANLIKDNLVAAEKLARTGTDETAVATASQLIKHYADLAKQATSIATKNALYDQAAEIGQTIAKKLTELGRSVQAASILGRLTPEGQVRFAAREIQKYNEAIDVSRGGILGLKKKIPELTGKQAQDIVTEMKAIQSMSNGTEKAMRFDKLQKYVSDLVPSSLYQKIVALWKAGLLTGLKTSGLNIMANISHAGLENVKNIPAKVIDSVASLFTGKKTIGLTSKGNLKGILEGFKKGLTYWKTGFDERAMGIKLDYKRVNFGKGKIAKALQGYEETVFRTLGTEDQPFYYGAKARSLADQAIAEATNKGLKGNEAKKYAQSLIENPSDQMVQYAVIDAETAVFQNQTVLGDIARKVQQAPGGEFVIPFGRTPSAVAMQIINYSPAGIIKTIIQNIGEGRFDQRLFSQGLGRGIVGTGILYLGSELFKKGMVTLDRPTTEKEQKLWELEGRKANSIKIGDKWRTVQAFGPAGNLLLVGGHFQESFNKSGSPTEAIMNGIFGTIKSFSEQTFLTGVNQILAAVTDPARSATSFAGQFISSIVPTIVSDVARSTDSLERRAETVLQRVQARVPFLRQNLQPQVDVLGKEIGTIGNPLEVMADPTRPSPIKDSPLINEFRRLADAGLPASPTLLGDKKGFPALTPEQNTDLWKRAGEIANQKMTNLIKSPEYGKLSDDVKAKTLTTFADKAKLNARVEKVIELTQGLQGEELKAELSKLKAGGLMTREVFDAWQKLR